MEKNIETENGIIRLSKYWKLSPVLLWTIDYNTSYCEEALGGWKSFLCKHYQENERVEKIFKIIGVTPTSSARPMFDSLQEAKTFLNNKLCEKKKIIEKKIENLKMYPFSFAKWIQIQKVKKQLRLILENIDYAKTLHL